jgi:hypothetical protein
VKPELRFKVLEWADEIYVTKVRLFGTDHHGQAVNKDVTFRELVTIDEVQTLVAKMNNGHYR